MEIIIIIIKCSNRNKNHRGARNDDNPLDDNDNCNNIIHDKNYSSEDTYEK